MSQMSTIGASLVAALIVTVLLSAAPLPAAEFTFPEGTATPSETCGACHKTIYNEFAHGFGGDIRYHEMTATSGSKTGRMPANVSGSITGHAFAGIDPFPIHARENEMGGKSCNVCHFPEAFAIPDPNLPEIIKPLPRPKGKETGGLTCASCHLTPEGAIRGPHKVQAPHPTVVDPSIQTSAMCAYCHSLGKRVVGKQTQTFLEWRDDYFTPGLGKQQCQDCHMPRTMRKVTETSNAPERAVARHLWTGGRSLQRLSSSLSLVIVQPDQGKGALDFHVINIGAGHSVPTGSNRRAVYLIATLVDASGKAMATKEWMFAPWYGDRPDDRKHLEDDRSRPDAIAAAQADNQGPHETVIRAGEERILSWNPGVTAGEYTVKARLVYDLNRYNPLKFADDLVEFNNATLFIKVGK